MFEPVELERNHLTDQDEEIRKADIPERFQVCKNNNSFHFYHLHQKG